MRARAVGRRRVGSAALLDLVLAAAAVALLALLVTTFSLRGDLAAAAIALCLAALSGVSVYRIWAAIRGRYRTELTTAEEIARTRGPLVSGGDPDLDAVLRHEILGAAQLHAGLRGHEQSRQHLGSRSLASAYVAEVGERAASRDHRLAVPTVRWGVRVLGLTVLVASAGLATTLPSLTTALALILGAVDGRPPEPPRPVWSSLDLEIEYPAHTGRPTRHVPNPSGALRVPAGTRIKVDLRATEPSEAVRVVVIPDAPELSRAVDPELFDLAGNDRDGLMWSGEFTVRAGGSWMVVMLDDEDGDVARRSPPLPLELEPDAPPEVELLPLPPSQREPSELDRVDIRFTARDDFGLASANLVFQIEDGEIQRLPAGKAPTDARQWRRRYTWDLSTIPIDKRSELTYWVEVRDNDPGLGLEALPDPPGKVASSAKQRLSVRDREQEHAQNIQGLRELRDAAVDLLARRLTTEAFAARGDDALGGLETARQIHGESSLLLAAFATLIDDLSIDTMVRERDVAGFIAIHGRLLELYRKEDKIHSKLPPGAELKRPAKVPSTLSKLGAHNKKEVTQLEDEIIRLDDLVDTQIIERLERLLDRAETTLAKLVELLEQLAAGDESVRPQIEQLEQRLREDLRRISEARSLLRKELGSEFMNLDALRRLEEQLEAMKMGNMLKKGETGGALDRARQLQEQLMQMRGQVQGRAAGNAQLSEEDRQRMELLRALGRLKDEQKTLQGETKGLHQEWREAVKNEKAQGADETASRAEKLRKELEKINDARLGREARGGWEDAREQLQQLEAMKDADDAKALELYETAQKAVEGLDKAVKGSKASEKEGKAVRRLQKRAETIRDELLRKLPAPAEALKGESLQKFEALRRKQDALRKQAEGLMQDKMSTILPQPGRQGMRSADRGMQRSSDSLGESDGGRSMLGQKRSLDGIQRAIDSLRRQSPPPSASASNEEASTEAERDRSYRDELMEAMREEAPDGFDDAVERYYEELLK